jgi:hypothetical protein
MSLLKSEVGKEVEQFDGLMKKMMAEEEVELTLMADEIN